MNGLMRTIEDMMPHFSKGQKKIAAYIFENYSEVYVPKDAIATYQSTLYWNITITDETGEYFAYTYLPLPTN
jgi:hypothetical protein